MGKQFLLSIDQGTTGTRVLLIGQRAEICAESYQKHTQYYPKSGWVEHNPNEIWDKVLEAVDDVLEKAEAKPHQVISVGIANQGETVMFWDAEEGTPLYSAIVWSCRRSASIAEQWGNDGDWGNKIIGKTGLRIDPYFSATKIRWMMENVPLVDTKINMGKARCSTLDSWLLWKMTGGKSFVTDASTAARTLLYNIQQEEWDTEILNYLEIQQEWLPDVLPTVGLFGVTKPNHFCGIEAPITVSMVDQPAALYGHLCVELGTSKCTYGTGCFAYMNVGNEVPPSIENSLLSTIVWRRNNETTYALDGAVYSADSVIEWAMDSLKLFRSINELQNWSMNWLQEDNSSNDLLFIPSLSGIGAPYWDSEARGVFLGLSHGTTPKEIARSMLEGIAHRVADVLDAMEDNSGQPLIKLRVDGGLTHNPYLMQFQADLLGIPVEVPEIAEATAMGIAYFLGESSHWWTQEELKQKMGITRTYEPRIPLERRKELRARWKHAIRLLTEYHKYKMPIQYRAGATD